MCEWLAGKHKHLCKQFLSNCFIFLCVLFFVWYKFLELLFCLTHRLSLWNVFPWLWVQENYVSLKKITAWGSKRVGHQREMRSTEKKSYYQENSSFIILNILYSYKYHLLYWGSDCLWHRSFNHAIGKWPIRHSSVVNEWTKIDQLCLKPKRITVRQDFV